MKKIFLTIVFLISLVAFGQNTKFNVRDQVIFADSVLVAGTWTYKYVSPFWGYTYYVQKADSTGNATGNYVTRLALMDTTAWVEGSLDVYLRNLSRNVSIGTQSTPYDNLRLYIAGSQLIEDTLFIGTDGDAIWAVADASLYTSDDWHVGATNNKDLYANDLNLNGSAYLTGTLPSGGAADSALTMDATTRQLRYKVLPVASGFLVWADTSNQLATDYNLTSKQNVSDTSVKDATRYWVGQQAYLTAESDPVWVSDSIDYISKWDTNNKVASRYWVGLQAYLTAEADPIWISDSTDYIHKSDTNTKVASRYWVGVQSYLTAELDPVWVSDSVDYISKWDTNNKVATRYWTGLQAYLTAESDPLSFHKADSNTNANAATKKYVDDGLSTKQATGSYEVTTNKSNVTGTSTTLYATQNLVKAYTDSVAALRLLASDSSNNVRLYPINALGDIIRGTGNNTYDVLTLGANDFVLTSDGSTFGWEAAGAGTGEQLYADTIRSSYDATYHYVDSMFVQLADSNLTSAGNYVSDAGMAGKLQNTISEGKAYNFDGTNDYVSLGTSTQLDLGTGDGTYFVRFKNDGNDGAENVLFDVADGTSGDRQVVELTTTGKVYGFFLNNSATYIDIQGNTDIGADNKIHSVAMSIDRSSATGLNVYLDGKTDATPVDATTIQGLSIVSSGTKYIGIHNAGSLYPFAGSIYDFKYFNMALSAAEIKDLSEGGSVPYKYTGASNTTLVTNGTLTSGTSWSRTGGVTLSGDKAVFDNATVGLCYQNATVTKGKQYRVTFTVSDLTEGGNQARIAMLDNTQSVYVLSPGNYVNGTHVVDFTALNNSTTFSLYCLTSSNSSFKVDDLSFIRIGEILSLDQPGMSTATWFDQSGNGINGTVSGASLYDSPLYTNVQNFNASGNVGIGTTSPAESFSVNGTTNLGNGAWPTTSLGKSNQRVSMISHTENDQNVNIGTMPLDGSVGINRGGYLTLFSRATTSGLDAAGGRILGAKASANSGTRSGYLKFYTSVFGGSFTLAMTIDSAQKIIALPTYSVTVGGTNRDLYIDDTGLIGYVSSDSSVKTKIKSMENINWLYKLRPVNYIYKSDSVKWKQYGLIAEEVDTINKWIVSYDYIFDSVTGDTLQKKVATVNYSRLIVPLVKSAQDQKEQLDALNPLITLITLTTGATTTGTITISNDSGIPKAGIAATMYFNSPSPVNFTPGVKQIANGQYDGQEIEIVGFDNTNTLTLDQNDNLKLKGGATWVGGKFDIIKLKWVNGLNNWIEVTRSDN